MYDEGYDEGSKLGDELNNTNIAHRINMATARIAELITGEGFDREAADEIDKTAGFIAGLADRINL